MSQSPSSAVPSSSGGSTQLVLIAGVIALIAVVLMNVYVEMRAKADAERTVTFFELRVDRERGDELQDRDVQPVQIPARYLEAFGTDAIKEDVERSGVPAGGYNRTFSVAARKGEILRDSMFIRNTSNRFGLDIANGNRLVTIPISTSNQPPSLSPDDFVDLYANVNRRTGAEAVLVMERVQVRMVGSRIVETGADTSSTRGVKYGNITIEIANPEFTKLANIQSRVSGNQFFIAVRDPADRAITLDVEPGTVNPDIMDMLGLNR